MGYQCKTCGALHPERPTCFGAEMPAVVAQLTPDDRARRVELSSDQCVLDGEHFFVLGTLDLPVQGSDEMLTWIVWTTLSKPNFERTADLWSVEGRESEPPYFGWLSNQIPGFPNTLNVKLRVHTQPVGERPHLEVVDEEHPLREAQQRGVSLEEADRLIHVALYGEPERAGPTAAGAP